eukprot:m.213429 g.213429  ORF g.213429 m.213429 type:complete len:1739 (-) comp33150_c0_seq1:110-5326(-)
MTQLSNKMKKKQNVNELDETEEFLAEHGVDANGLSLERVLPAIGFPKARSYVQVLQKHIESNYSDDLFATVPLPGGGLENVAINPPKAKEIEKKLMRVLAKLRNRFQFATQGSRGAFGQLGPEPVSIAMDFSEMAIENEKQYRGALKALLSEQLQTTQGFNMLRAEAYTTNKLFSTGNFHTGECGLSVLNRAEQWINQLSPLRPNEEPDLVDCLECAIEDTQNSGIILIADGPRRENLAIALRRAREYHTSTGKPVHTVMWCTTGGGKDEDGDSRPAVVDKATKSFLKDIANVTGGRFHMFMGDLDNVTDNTGIGDTMCDNPVVKRLKTEIGLCSGTLAMVRALVLEAQQQSRRVPVQPKEEDKGPQTVGRWLQLNGMKARKLGLRDVLQPCSYRHAHGDLTTLDCDATQNVSGIVHFAANTHEVHAKVCEGLTHYRHSNGAIVHVFITGAIAESYRKRCLKAIEDYEGQLRKLQAGSRALFGELKTEGVVLLIACGKSMQSKWKMLYTKVKSLIKEQIEKKRRFNIVTYGGTVQSWRVSTVAATASNCKAALDWFKTIKPHGVTQFSEAVHAALDDDSAESGVIVSDGMHHELEEDIKDLIATAVNDRGFTLSTVSFGCRDRNLNQILHDIAVLGEGGFQYFTNNLSDKPLSPKHVALLGPPARGDNPDVTLLLQEIQLVHSEMEKVVNLRTECDTYERLKKVGSGAKIKYKLLEPPPEPRLRTKHGAADKGLKRVAANEVRKQRSLAKNERVGWEQYSKPDSTLFGEPPPPPTSRNNTSTSRTQHSTHNLESALHTDTSNSTLTTDSVKESKPSHTPQTIRRSSTSLTATTTMNTTTSPPTTPMSVPRSRRSSTSSIASTKSKKAASTINFTTIGTASTATTTATQAYSPTPTTSGIPDYKRIPVGAEQDTSEWLDQYSLASLRLTIQDALAKTARKRKGKWVPDPHGDGGKMVYGKVFHDAYKVAYFPTDGEEDVDDLERSAKLGTEPLSNGGDNDDERELVYVFPEAANLVEYQQKVQRVLKTYSIRLLQLWKDEGLNQLYADRGGSLSSSVSTIYDLVDHMQEADLVSVGVRSMFDEISLGKTYLVKAREFTDRKMYQPPPPAQDQNTCPRSVTKTTPPYTSSANFVKPTPVTKTNTWSKHYTGRQQAPATLTLAMPGNNTDEGILRSLRPPSFSEGRSVYAQEIVDRTLNTGHNSQPFPLVSATRTMHVGVGQVNPLYTARPWPKLCRKAIKLPPQHGRTHPQLGRHTNVRPLTVTRAPATRPSTGQVRSTRNGTTTNNNHSSRNKPKLKPTPNAVERVLALCSQLERFCIGVVSIGSNHHTDDRITVDFDDGTSEVVLLDNILILPKPPLPPVNVDDYVLVPDPDSSSSKGAYIPAQVEDTDGKHVSVDTVDGQTFVIKRPKMLKILKSQYLTAAAPWLDHMSDSGSDDGDGHDNHSRRDDDDDGVGGDDDTREGHRNANRKGSSTRGGHGEQVLVRWDKDGWFYPSLLVGRSTNSKQVRVRDVDESERWVASSEVFVLDTTSTLFPTQSGSHVLAEHARFRDSFAPAVVTSIDGASGITVKFFDESSAHFRPDDRVVCIQPDQHSAIVRVIRQQEDLWIGRHVMSRDDNDGQFYAGKVEARLGTGSTYRVKLDDATKAPIEQMRNHMFSRDLDLGDGVGVDADFAPGDGVIAVGLGPCKILWKAEDGMYAVEAWNGDKHTVAGTSCFHCGGEYAVLAASYLKSLLHHSEA